MPTHDRSKSSDIGTFIQEELDRLAAEAVGKPSGEVVTVTRADLVALASDRQKLTDEIENWKRLAMKDALTGIGNRRALMEVLDRAIDLRRRYGGEPFSFLLADIDHFKQVNDTYGHQAGDQVLCQLAEIFQKSIRASDLVARYGGEEFGILGEHTNGQAAFMGEHLRRVVENTRFEIRMEVARIIKVTVSIGISTFYPPRNWGQINSGGPLVTSEELIRHADLALYRAKEAGRNQVWTCRDGLGEPVPASVVVRGGGDKKDENVA